MSKLRSILAVSFRAKVLFPVVAVMTLMAASLMWMDSRRTGKQLHADAATQLQTADKIFNHWESRRADDLLARFQILATARNFRAAAAQADANAFRAMLRELLGEKAVNVNIIAVLTDQGQLFPPVTDDPRVDAGAFVQSCRNALSQAMKGQPKVDLVRNDEQLFDVVALPIPLFDVSTGNCISGAVCFGVKNSLEKEFNQLTHAEVALFAGGRMVSSTISDPAARAELAKFAETSVTRPDKERGALREILLSGEHSLGIAGPLGDPDQHLGYIILSSYEDSLVTLRHTQITILLLSALAILCGTGVVWLLVHKATEPLSELRHSVEAVGHGDFSRRVEIRYDDEVGELGRVFNEMTENLKNSREQLELTVETLKITQAQLVQSEKLSGIGEFVAGVAHELNNPLTAVMGFSELLQRSDTLPKHRSYLEMIHRNSLRCQKIVQSLLSFARRHQPERKLACLNSMVEAALEIVQYQMCTNNIEVVLSLQRDLPKAMVDPHQIQQVFLNIINNARQAIESHRPSGSLRITSERSGDFARVTFQDDGPGIPEENLARIFDPFFTTKDVGKGTGLGLSLCYGIIREHGGTIQVRSKPGEGAAFIIDLPLAPEEIEAQSDTDSATATVTRQGLGCGKRALVIDDEEPILRLVQEMLQPEGFEVDLASNGAAALQRLEQGHYDLAFCDWKMPGITGREVYEHIRSANPALSNRVIFITGDVINENTRKFLDENHRICLSKPFNLQDFRVAVHRTLAQG